MNLPCTKHGCARRLDGTCSECEVTDLRAERDSLAERLRAMTEEHAAQEVRAEEWAETNAHNAMLAAQLRAAREALRLLDGFRSNRCEDRYWDITCSRCGQKCERVEYADDAKPICMVCTWKLAALSAPCPVLSPVVIQAQMEALGGQFKEALGCDCEDGRPGSKWGCPVHGKPSAPANPMDPERSMTDA